ncbi:Enterococcal surface protein [Enterococcus faecalis]|uniref:Rib/alpha-like domain-containing protein n=1 Tax=Enterococcus faecalis TaxID=1351 RepID=UPI000D8A6D6A|nr:Rib/alpha-like domain-containing protein [Enterococcus faecalis]UON29608.1 YSIRK-type signal peptide-containing protein [Enterococcus faecalis]WPG51905.1 Rib/alpha-like domain-containing protein [Enterococcus faecalis]SPW36833.1 Enterococcal surface protein [Enterococcus faecalis]STC86982.1 Enterococcal surface protein [Enterococcus faecalis]
MFGKNNKHMILKKGRKRVLKYSIKKLSVGVASVLVGVGLVFGATGIVNAQMGEGRLVNYSASGNTFQENPGYTKNYNFSDLQFNPKAITGDVLQGNTIDFEVYGKHNIAASTANWEIRLQLDERLAQYVEKIQVDPKKGVGNSRRTFVRINDSLGRPTNIWKVNYIRANDGLFAGAETTDTQTAPNGVITFEKNLDEIFKEIGADNLKSDRLMYRIYLVSHQDDDKIVPGIESAGYFLTDQDDFYNKLDVSENNSDQFKHGSVNTKYEEANIQTKDGSGSTGANGAIILDHKLTKEKNFSYSTSAKGTPWYANYKIDERLVPYVSGIQMHMVQADKVAYNVSFESGKKVADLAIERREGHENYGMGSITDNDLTKLIDFANASPRPIVVRYVLQLTKPLDEILEEMKAADKIEENAPFGEDFIFDSWLSDTNKKLIQNTYGTGYYYLQDIDGDGNPDDKEESGDTNPYIGKPELEEVYDVDTTVKGKVFIHELAGTDHKAQLVDKEGTVLAEKTIAPNEKDGAPISDTVEFEFTGVDSSKLIAKDELKIQIVSPGFDKPEEGSTVIKESPKAVDKQTVVVGFKPDAKESIRNNKNLPEDAEYSWKKEPDTSNVTDSTKGIVTVKIGNRTFDVDVEFAVKASQAMENDATYVPITTTPETTIQSGKPTFDKPDVPLANDAFSILDVYNKDFGNASVDANTGIVTFTPAKGVGESEPITGTIPIKIVYQDGSVGTTDLAVTVSKNIYENPGENIPAGYHKVTFTAGEGTSIESGTTVFAVKDGVSLPEDKLPVLKAKDGYTDAKWPEEATQPIKADDTEFVSSATKLDDKSDADKYTPEGQKVTTELNKEPDASEGIKNKKDLPKDAKYTWKEKVDISTAGNKKGTVVVTYSDGSSDEVEVDVTVTDNRSDADKYEPTVEGEKVEIGGKVDLTDNVTNLPTLPQGTTITDVTPGGTIDTNTPGNYEGVIEVTYPDGTKDTVKVPVEVTDNRSDADKYEPTVEGEKVEIGGKVDLTDNVTNLPTLPQGTTITDVTPGGTIDTNTPGNYEGVIEVTYPDGTKDTVKVPVEVTDNRSDADKYEPTVEGEKVEIGGKVDLTDNVTNLPTLPQGTTVTDVTPGGTIDTNTPGNYEGVIEVTYPDGTKDTVKVPVEVTDNRSDADKYTPMVEGEKVEIGGKVDLTDNVTNLPTLPQGTTVTDVTPGGTIDTNTPGNYEGVIEVTYPDGTKDTVKVPVEVTDNRSDADKYEPTVEGEKVEIGGKVDLTDNVTNLPTLPQGTTITDVTPGGTIDTNTPGNYEGVIEVTYPDGTKDTVKVPVEVTDNRSDADKYEPTVEGEKVEIGGKVDLTDNVTNLPTLPQGTTITDVTPGGTIDTNTPGNYEGVIEVTYPDGTKDTVKVPVEVTDNRSDADKYEPTVEGEKVEIGGKVDLTDNVTNLPTLPQGTTITDVTPGGTIDTNAPGNYEGVIEVTYPDGTKDTVKVPVEVTDNRSDADKYTPKGQKVTTELNKEPEASDGIKNKSDLPKGTMYVWKEKVDVGIPGNKKATVIVIYPDGSKEEVEVVISVVDKKAPNKPQVDPITDVDKIVTGKTEPNADVTVTLPDGSQYHGTADKSGYFKVNVPKLEAGTKVKVTSTDESGNTSEPTDVVVSSNELNGGKGNGTDSKTNNNQDKKQFLKTYPKTGEVDSNIYTIAGGLILLGTLGLLGYEKWKKEDE